jgi:integrase
MTMPRPAQARKPNKTFPLFIHQRGYWAKKVRGKLHYFGRVADDPKGKAALEKWLEQKDDLMAGRMPKATAGGTTIRDLCNQFLAGKKALVDTGELTARTFAELFNTCKRVGEAFGWRRQIADIHPDEFASLRRAIARQWGPIRVGNEVQRVRCLFKFAADAGLVNQPVRFGPDFRKPSRKVLRLHRAQAGPRMIEAHELRAVIATAPVPLKAMILLGLNCGYGNTDVAALPMHAIDLDGGWVDFARTKTGVTRRCPLWPETVEAIREALAQRPKPRDARYNDLVFITPRGNPYRVAESRDRADGGFHLVAHDFIGKQFTALIKELGVHRRGVGFYTLRHVFATVAGDSRDQVAVNSIMGHVDETMASVYRERIEDARLLAVVEHVRRWLFGAEENR